MDPRFAPQPSEAACRPLELAATGGPVLDGPKTLAVRATAITWPTARTLPSKPGRRVIAAPIAATKLFTQGFGPKQVTQVTGTDATLLHFKDFTVQPIPARHGEPPAFSEQFAEAYEAASAPTADQRAAETAIRAKGTFDPRIIDQGTIAFGITFDDGFRVAYRDSGGSLTSYEKARLAEDRGRRASQRALARVPRPRR